jgi:hypothetical protein
MQALCQFASTLCLSLSAMAFVLAADTRIARADDYAIDCGAHCTCPNKGECAGSSSCINCACPTGGGTCYNP